jgi:hypothetical protein
MLMAGRHDPLRRGPQHFEETTVRTACTTGRMPSHVLDEDVGLLARQEPRHQNLGAFEHADSLAFSPERGGLQYDAIACPHRRTIPLTTPVVATVLQAMSTIDRSWPVATAVVGATSAGTVVWRFGGYLMVTVVAKASFALVPDGPMSRLVPESFHRSERADRGPMASVTRTCELAPQLREVDVLMTGHAHPPHAGATEAAVRLAVQTESALLLDRVLYAVGDPDPATGGRVALRPTPLGYERAYGGIGFADNPLGVGYGANANEAPNLVNPRSSTEVASFAPIPASFPTRKQLLGDLPRSALSERILELPDAFDWSYFQAAPRPQRLTSLRGGEWLTLEGVFPAMSRLQTQLPRLDAAAQVHSFAPRGVQVPEVVPLRLDTVHVDADEGSCHLVFRGSFPLADEEALDSLLVVAALEPAGATIAWPHATAFDGASLQSPDATATRVPAVRRASSEDAIAETIAADAVDGRHEGTVALGPGAPMPGLGAGAPFALARPGGSSAQPAIPGAPWASSEGVPEVVMPSPSPVRGEATMAVEPPSVVREREEREQRKLREQERELREQELARQRREAQEAEHERERVEAEARRRAADDAERARREAKARREAEAEHFRLEQEAAKRDAEQRAAQKAAERREQTEQVKRNLYGAFKKKH